MAILRALRLGRTAEHLDASRPGFWWADETVPLRQLLAVATLTPAQAALIARDVVTAERALAGATSRPVAIDPASVAISTDGQVCFEPDWRDSAARNGAASGLSEVIAELVRNVQANGPQRRHATARFLRLGEADGDVALLTARVQEVAAELLDGRPDAAAVRVRRSLGAVVAASRGLEPEEPVGAYEVVRSAPVPAIAPRVVAAAGGRRVPSRYLYHRKRGRRRWAPALIGATGAAVVIAGWWAGPRVWAELQDGWDTLFGSSNPPPVQIEPVAPPPPPPADDDADEAADDSDDDSADDDDSGDESLEPPAPESAGPITGVSLESVAGDCDPGEQCTVYVEVELESGAARQVSWELEIVDRCGGDTDTQPGVSVQAQAGWTRVWGNSVIEVPSGDSLAIFAVTESPDRAASEPLLVPDDDASC